MKKITLRDAFDEILRNSEIGKMICVKPEYLSREVAVDEVEDFVAEVHRNSLILYNKVHEMK